MANQQHQPFDDDPALFEDDPELQGGQGHGQDEADDRATLLVEPAAADAPGSERPRADRTVEETQPDDDE